MIAVLYSLVTRGSQVETTSTWVLSKAEGCPQEYDRLSIFPELLDAMVLVFLVRKVYKWLPGGFIRAGSNTRMAELLNVDRENKVTYNYWFLLTRQNYILYCSAKLFNANAA